jgi:hypothetical protein
LAANLSAGQPANQVTISGLLLQSCAEADIPSAVNRKWLTENILTKNQPVSFVATHVLSQNDAAEDLP